MPKASPDPVRPQVSAVMPCLDEARTLPACITKAQAAFAAMGVTGEVIVADNGSSDGSRELAAALGARVIEVPQRGYGAALMGGIEAARGEVIVLGDADDSYDWSAIEPFVRAIEAGHDLVMGNRFRGGIRPGAMSFSHRWIGNPLLSFIARVAFRTPIGDFHSGMRALTPAAYARMKLRTPGMEFATEMVANAVLAGLRIGEVPIVLHPDGRDRPPHLATFRDGWRHLRFIITYAPTWLFLVPALVALLLGFSLVALLAAGPAEVGPWRLGIHWLALGSMLGLTGLALAVFGLLAKLVIVRAHPAAADRLVGLLRARFSLERGLLGGGLIALGGLSVVVAVIARFVAAGGGPSESTVHPTIAGGTVFLAGIQVCFASFLVRLMNEETER